MIDSARTRILFLSGYIHPSHHRKVELLADDPAFSILHVAWPGGGREPGVYSSANGRQSYRVIVAPVRWLGARDDAHRVVYTSLRLGLRRFKPHIVHCEQEQEGLMSAQVALLRWAFARSAALVLYSWQNILRARRLRVRLLSALTRSAASHILCASQEAVSVLRRQGYRGGASVTPMFGVDRRYFYPKTATAPCIPLDSDDFVVGYVGRLVPQKGVDTLLSALALMPRPAQLLVVGDGPALPDLLLLARRLGIAERCHFVGQCPYDRLVDYLNSMQVLVLPSRTSTNWKEQFGRVLVEAMACRVPVIGSDSGAIPEVIDGAGRIFPEGDAAALSRQLAELSADAQLRASLAQAGCERVDALYTVERLAEHVAAVWRALAPTESGR